jgi:hypothetical protein
MAVILVFHPSAADTSFLIFEYHKHWRCYSDIARSLCFQEPLVQTHYRRLTSLSFEISYWLIDRPLTVSLHPVAVLIYDRKMFNSSVYIQQILCVLQYHIMFRLDPAILRCSRTKTMSTYVKITVKTIYYFRSILSFLQTTAGLNKAPESCITF